MNQLYIKLGFRLFLFNFWQIKKTELTMAWICFLSAPQIWETKENWHKNNLSVCFSQKLSNLETLNLTMIKLTKTPILSNHQVRNDYFGKTSYFFQIAQFLAKFNTLVTFVSVSLVSQIWEAKRNPLTKS